GLLNLLQPNVARPPRPMQPLPLPPSDATWALSRMHGSAPFLGPPALLPLPAWRPANRDDSANRCPAPTAPSPCSADTCANHPLAPPNFVRYEPWPAKPEGRQ